MSPGLDDALVIASLLLSAMALYSFGFRIRARTAAVGLVALPFLVWLVGRLWLFQVLDESGLPRLLGALPAVLAYVAVVAIVVRKVGGLTYRLNLPRASFVRDLRAADAAMRRAYQQEPAFSPDGRVLVDPARRRLDAALKDFAKLQPPSAEWARLVDDRLHLHREYVQVLLSPTPVGSEILEPLKKRSREWEDSVRTLAAEEATSADSGASSDAVSRDG